MNPSFKKVGFVGFVVFLFFCVNFFVFFGPWCFFLIQRENNLMLLMLSEAICAPPLYLSAMMIH